MPGGKKIKDITQLQNGALKVQNVRVTPGGDVTIGKDAIQAALKAQGVDLQEFQQDQLVDVSVSVGVSFP